ncbi:hypothetical protein AGMMS49982_07330 [Bacteroidia bacterium]|nr:hypothetical protein AGMMS49982_07330 [Bacteroidia bacterium]
MMFNDRIKQLREDRHIPQRKFLRKASANQTCLNLPNRSQKSRKQLAAALDIDTAAYCKIEHGERSAKRKQIPLIATLLQIDENALVTLWLADKIIAAVDDEKELAGEALETAKQTINIDIDSK